MKTSKVVIAAMTITFCTAPCVQADTSSAVVSGTTSSSSSLQGGVTKSHVTHHPTATYHTSATHNKTYLQSHPKVEGAAVGGLTGAGVGAVAGLVTGRGMMRGALFGGGAGAGVGVIHNSQTMKAHPMIKDTAEGTLAGAGLGMAVHRGHGTGRTALKAGALGGALGLGAGFLGKELSK